MPPWLRLISAELRPELCRYRVDEGVAAGLSSVEIAVSGLVATNTTSTARRAIFPGGVFLSSHFVVMVTKYPVVRTILNTSIGCVFIE